MESALAADDDGVIADPILEALYDYSCFKEKDTNHDFFSAGPLIHDTVPPPT